MRTLITGGAGFIGSHLCERFLAEGHEVVAVDNMITGDLANLDHLRTNSRFRFIGHDISNPLKVKEKLDNVLHFASPASPVDYLEHPIPTLKVGALGTHNTLGLAKAHGARYLLASTSEVYGDPLEHPQKESYWGNVNPIGVRGCFSADTEILTGNGWKTFPDVTTDDDVLTRRADGVLEYHKPTEVIRQRYVGELIGFKNTKIDLLVTPNHKMLVRLRDDAAFQLVEAYQAIRWDRAEMAKSGRWEGEERASFLLPLVPNAKTPQRDVIPMDLWLEFLGYFLSEGCTYCQPRTKTVKEKVYHNHAHLVFISQSQKKPENRAKIRRCLQELGYHFHEENAQFRIQSKQLWTYLRQFGKAREKFVPRELLLLPPRQLRILFDALMLGDGTADGRKYYSSSPALVGAVQEILLKLGLAGAVHAKSPGRSVWSVHVLTGEPKDYLTPHYPKRHVEWYDGEVHCVTVPNHVIYVRRNGRAVWCGNCYDEAKRFAESITMAYHRAHGVNTHIIRIFNSVLADETVIAFDEEGMHLGPVGELADRIRYDHDRRRVLVPAFDPVTLRMELKPALALTEHEPRNDAFEISLRYGRNLKVTGDHSVFVEGPNGRPVPKFARDLRPGDRVAIPARLPVVERDRAEIDVAAEFSARGVDDAWDWAVRHPDLARQVEERREEVNTYLGATGRYKPTRSLSAAVGVVSRTWIRRKTVPLAAVKKLGLTVPPDAKILPHRSSNHALANRLPVTDDLLWLMGFYLAEGAEHSGDGVHFISFSSDEHYLRRAKEILEREFGARVGFVEPNPTRAPSIYVHSKVLHRLFRDVLRLRDRRIPLWVMQLPLSRVKHFLEGFRCGDGTHSGKKLGNELCFDTVSEQLATDLTYLLLRFGIVASFGRYETTFKAKYGDRKFPFYRLTICEVDNFDILTWDTGVTQTLNARRIGDLVWATVREIKPCLLTARVYDFSVPGCENFVAGNGIVAHNTYGERMRLNDGRVLPNFMYQALMGEPLTVYGKGDQTRSFQYVSDLVEGIWRLLPLDYHEPVNLGNPAEITILEFAEEIRKLAGSTSEIVYRPIPQDDPKVRQPDITRARQLLGWEPKVGRDEGLKRTMDFFRRKLEK